MPDGEGRVRDMCRGMGWEWGGQDLEEDCSLGDYYDNSMEEALSDIAFALRSGEERDREQAVSMVRREQAIRKLAKVKREGVVGYR